MSRKAKSKLKTGLAYLFVGLGMLLALLGLGIDYLLPGTSPGLNIPQLLIIIAGLALAAGAWRFRSARPRRRIRASKARAIAISLLLSLVTLFALEFVLTIGGIPTYFPSEIPDRGAIVRNLRICDDLGCRPRVHETRRRCADGTFTGRQCIVNEQGFGDSEDFVVKDDFDERTRIILMGDSYTQGYSADIGKSFAEYLEAAFPEFIIWNTGISGNGTRHAEAAFRAFAPQLRPQLAILGFFTNDFRDNLLQGERMVLQDNVGFARFVRRFDQDLWGNPVQLPADVVNAYLAAGYKPPVSELERAIGLTRLGTLALRIIEGLGAGSIDESMENQLRLTTDYLTRLRDGATAQETTLLVLLVPLREDIDDVSELYLAAIGVMEDLEIPYLDPRQYLDPVSDYAALPDAHWSNSGHQEIGAVLAECIQSFIASGNLSNCDNVVMPTRPSAS